MTTTATTKLRLLTGDTPTGRLHLGHLLGSIEARVALQDAGEMYTDPKRLRATDPGDPDPERNPVFAMPRALSLTEGTGEPVIDAAAERYREGRIGDAEVKKILIDLIEFRFAPIRARREKVSPTRVALALSNGRRRAREVAAETMGLVSKALRQDFCDITLDDFS